jgi:putative aldouronate transport system substrate-binding protein
MKKYLTVVLSLLLLLSCVAIPCAASEEPVTIRWAFSNYSAHEDFDTTTGVYAAINKQFNVDIQPFVTNYLQNQEQFSMLLSSGDIPDVWYDWNWRIWNQQGMIRTFDISTFQEKMPYIWENVVMTLDPELNGFKLRTTEDGKIIGFPSYTVQSGPFFRRYRKDWLDALNLDVPTTLEEFETYMQAIAEKDPDGNGVADTYGAPLTLAPSMMGDILGAFGLPTDFGFLADENGKIVYAPSTQQFKELLQTLAKWYASGWVSPESVTMDGGANKQLFANGKLGSWHTDAFNHDVNYENSAVGLLNANCPNVEYADAKAMKGKNGKCGTYTYGTDFGWSLVFGVQTSDAVVDKVLAIVDHLCSPEGYLTQWGEEGVDYKLVDGKVTATQSNKDNYSKGIGVFPVFDGKEVLGYSAGTGEYARLLTFSFEQPIRISAIAGWSLPNSDESGYSANITTAWQEYYWNVIMGTKDLESTWDAYIAELESLGLREMEAEAQEIYDNL